MKLVQTKCNETCADKTSCIRPNNNHLEKMTKELAGSSYSTSQQVCKNISAVQFLLM